VLQSFCANNAEFLFLVYIFVEREVWKSTWRGNYTERIDIHQPLDIVAAALHWHWRVCLHR